MKYVYVVTSTEKDLYYEQFLISAASLRLHNPDAEIIVLTDNATNKSLNGGRSAYEQYISDKKVITTPSDFSAKESSRWIKTSIHHHVSGEFLFIDCDTVITETLNQHFPEEIKIGAVLDTHATLDKHHLRTHFQKEDMNVGFASSLKSNVRYNGGLIYHSEYPSAEIFFEKWHSLWIESMKKGCSQDMPSLNQANYEMNNIITALDGEWNCQISHNGLPFLADSKIIHYYATSLVSLVPAYKLASPAILGSIKESGELSPEILRLLENPKTAFEPFSRIISDKKTINAIDHSLFFKLLRFGSRLAGKISRK